MRVRRVCMVRVRIVHMMGLRDSHYGGGYKKGVLAIVALAKVIHAAVPGGNPISGHPDSIFLS